MTEIVERLRKALTELADAADVFEAETATVERRANPVRLLKAIEAAEKILGFANEQRTPDQDAALQELVNQAQELDMGYGRK